MKVLSDWIIKRFVQVRESDKAQGYVEYILIIGLVGLVTTAALITFQGKISTALGNIGTSLAAD